MFLVVSVFVSVCFPGYCICCSFCDWLLVLCLLVDWLFEVVVVCFGGWVCFCGLRGLLIACCNCFACWFSLVFGVCRFMLVFVGVLLL